MAAEIERLARRAFPIVSADIRDHLTRDAFVDALDPSDLSLRVRVQEPKTLQDDLTSAIKLEVVLNQMERPKTPSYNPLPRGTELKQEAVAVSSWFMPHAMLFTPSRLLSDSRSFIKGRGKLTAQKQPLPPEYILACAFLRPSAF